MGHVWGCLRKKTTPHRLCPARARRWALALQVFVLGATLLAWATSYIHSYKASLWGLAAVVTFISIISCNNIYSAWEWSTVGVLHGAGVGGCHGAALPRRSVAACARACLPDPPCTARRARHPATTCVRPPLLHRAAPTTALLLLCMAWPF